ncbi:LacI family DNA-binding transcriptional regulator [Meiothermus ruber]|jgi:LacI family transcriptional regulator|uniref:LacI family transcriptional regulator n=1 Tax=Meiothermus ruber (strain ATCC 35948 / DSM 1279 / VKM B-1258 / 21) TaxID=504728 RepID=D3PMF6_MEIRD|nr:substrate-binding domain-containing protein [Meiothermus ruber]ADD29262.1 transcriptional regulator, LacI family [Meiothermus ruber DSM 1279]AGK05287.1 LacI family transcriptional regulator [Meiothermus ruber DSM 1279]MCL6529216.1 substrate-binding domain-containing protein [Meiothermus ruber]
MVNLDDVAKLAQVSPATVSRALSRPEMVAEATRKRILQAAQELGYQPNQLARSLRQRSSQTLGLIITDILNPFHATLAKGVQDAAEKHNYTVFLFNTDEDPEKERRALNVLRGHQPRGLLIVPSPQAKENLKLVTKLPIVELDRTSGTPGIRTVMVDNVGGARKAVQHLIDLGHRRIGMIVGRLDISTAVERLQGYREALQAAGIPYDETLVRLGNHREADGRAAAQALLSMPPDKRPTALFVGNNEMTVGAVLALREMGIRIPQELSVVGFDDSRWAATIEPALTVVAQPTYELGFLACETLLSSLSRGQDTLPTSIRLDTSFILRESTAPPGGRKNGLKKRRQS